MREQFAAIGHRLKDNLSAAADLMILNFLFILCCIPVITVGAAEAACYSGIFRMLRGERVTVSPSLFFKDFTANFKKATAGWLIELLLLLILAGDAWFALYYSKPANTFFLIFAIAGAAIILLAGVWFYPLAARFENKTKVHIKNSFLMALAHFPKTLLALILKLAILLVPFALIIGWFWLLFGFSLPMYLIAKMFRTTLKCEPKEDTDNYLHMKK